MKTKFYKGARVITARKLDLTIIGGPCIPNGTRAIVLKRCENGSVWVDLENFGKRRLLPDVLALDPSNPKFYRQVFTVEVLSEDPIPDDMDITDIVAEATDGAYSMQMKRGSIEELNAQQAARALQKQGSDPSFFQLSANGVSAKCD